MYAILYHNLLSFSYADHVGCVNIERVPQLERNPEGLWFCRNTCEQVRGGWSSLHQFSTTFFVTAAAKSGFAGKGVQLVLLVSSSKFWTCISNAGNLCWMFKYN